MKRDWDVIRDILLKIENEEDLFASLPEKPKWNNDLSVEDNLKAEEVYRQAEGHLCGHLEILIESGYIDGLQVIRAGHQWSWGLFGPRLKMPGHDLLDTLRPVGMPQRLTKFANERGVELTIDTIKAVFGAFVGSVLA
ncbi:MULTISPECIES: DUF2513 domain-containing protein [Aeromonas]|jgi:hypothetical protein|uniref:DUF2513 domain-containing protein n=1 Tax=Aeromonas TaxID=642 RepID=UPI00073C6C94|nr:MULTISPECIES: DUF2513 domain-containing protein [Aeromonas]AUY11754.1 DUF2513 domain-containing protein [Aeromonas sp. ASNIH2]KTA79150.1 hypothetical protein VO70_20875 [Aeromonas salmonicida]MBL0486797.1 DUF2513 domain-containing protein [Aeromonas caviae]OEG05081.1 hypothetical protein BFW25_00690 [Aeromonas caviae]RRA91571.1 DUF2513 domain-containing protein [Aeromonas veronii bv. sobria]